MKENFISAHICWLTESIFISSATDLWSVLYLLCFFVFLVSCLVRIFVSACKSLGYALVWKFSHALFWFYILLLLPSAWISSFCVCSHAYLISNHAYIYIHIVLRFPLSSSDCLLLSVCLLLVHWAPCQTPVLFCLLDFGYLGFLIAKKRLGCLLPTTRQNLNSYITLTSF